jgi:hypothetical protein
MNPVDLSNVRHSPTGVQGAITFPDHFVEQMKSKEIPPENVIAALRDPEQVTEVRRYPGQKRYCGYGVAVVIDGDHAVTLYLDQVVTALRPDQMHDKAALASLRAGLPSMSRDEARELLTKPAKNVLRLNSNGKGIY